DDLRAKTIQSQIYQPESKGNPQGRAPARNVGLGLGPDRFNLGLWDHLKLCVHSRPPSESGLGIGHSLSLRWHEAQVVTILAVSQHIMKFVVELKGLSG